MSQGTQGFRARSPNGKSWSCFWDAGEDIPPDAAAKIKRLRRQGWKIVDLFLEKPSPEPP
jgi:hypothetical protein